LDRKALQAVISLARGKGDKSVMTTKLDGKAIITHVIAEVAKKKGKELSKMAAKDQPPKKEQLTADVEDCVTDVLNTTLNDTEAADLADSATDVLDGSTEQYTASTCSYLCGNYDYIYYTTYYSYPYCCCSDYYGYPAFCPYRRRRQNRGEMATMCDFLDAPELIANKTVEDYVDCLIAANKTYEAEVLVLSILDLPKSIALDSFAEELFKVLGLKDAEELLVDLLKLPEDMLLEKLSAEAVETLVETLIVTFEAETGFEELCTVVLEALNKVLPQPTSLTCSLSDTAGEKKGGKDKKGKAAKKAPKGGKGGKADADAAHPHAVTTSTAFHPATNSLHRRNSAHQHTIPQARTWSWYAYTRGKRDA